MGITFSHKEFKESCDYSELPATFLEHLRNSQCLPWPSVREARRVRLTGQRCCLLATVQTIAKLHVCVSVCYSDKERKCK
jgi:hypothetical protein